MLPFHLGKVKETRTLADKRDDNEWWQPILLSYINSYICTQIKEVRAHKSPEEQIGNRGERNTWASVIYWGYSMPNVIIAVS